MTPAVKGKYDTGDPYRFEVANAMWCNTNFETKPEYRQTLAQQFKATFAHLEFANKEASAAEINGWVREKTHDKIDKLVPADALGKDTSIVLTNAVWFKGSWNEAFPEHNTKDGDFTNQDGSKTKTKLMATKQQTMYYEDDHAQVIQLPYKGNATMTVVLPKNPNDVDTLDAAYLRHAKTNATGEKVIITFPKFKVEQTFELGDVLQQLGITDAFNDAKADFGGIALDETDRTKISRVIHKSFIDLDEKGTEAAAATAVVMMRCTSVAMPVREEPKVFKADRPFTYAIQDATGAILFAGRIAQM
jgi:serpin B